MAFFFVLFLAQISFSVHRWRRAYTAGSRLEFIRDVAVKEMSAEKLRKMRDASQQKGEGAGAEIHSNVDQVPTPLRSMVAKVNRAGSMNSLCAAGILKVSPRETAKGK